MTSFEGGSKRRRTGVPPAPPRFEGEPDAIAERANEDFAIRYGRQPKRRTELIRYTMHARFMGRWSAP
jgi:hypothetical protein